MVDKCLKQFSKSRHSIGHLLWRCFIDCGGAGEGEEHDIISESPHCFLFPLSFKPYFTHSFIDHLEPWLQKHTRHKNYLSHQGSQMDTKAVWDRLLDSVKPNASGKQPFDVKLNSPIYEHAILNTKSTLSTNGFWVSRTGCLKKEHGLGLMYTPTPISALSELFFRCIQENNSQH